MISQKGPAMKQALLVLTVLLTVCAAAVAAQQNGPDLLKPQQDLARTVPTEDSPSAGGRDAVGGNNGPVRTPFQEPKPAGGQKKKPPPVNKPPVKIKMPTIDARMVGYMYNAIVGSEAGIRFDADFNHAFP